MKNIHVILDECMCVYACLIERMRLCDTSEYTSRLIVVVAHCVVCKCVSVRYIYMYLYVCVCVLIVIIISWHSS
jgi:hypothetical protein